MIKKLIGTTSYGLMCPIYREGEDVKAFILDSIFKATDGDIEEGDLFGITESIVARGQGNYCTIDDIVQSLHEKFDKHLPNKKELGLWSPIMSRNRFSLILRALARYADKLLIYVNESVDDQGNPTHGVNPFTGVDIEEYYKQICKEENCEVMFKSTTVFDSFYKPSVIIDCRCHPENTRFEYTLKDVMTNPINGSGYNEDYGVLGSNKADEERLKLFPRRYLAQILVNEVQEEIFKITGKNVEVFVYADGCFHSPMLDGQEGTSINEFADPVTSPAFTTGLYGTPNEIKIKNFADGKYKDLKGEELEKAIKEEIRTATENSLVGSMSSQGTTPRRIIDLVVSLADLTSGSGSKGCPIVLIRNYFKNYAK